MWQKNGGGQKDGASTRHRPQEGLKLVPIFLPPIFLPVPYPHIYRLIRKTALPMYDRSRPTARPSFRSSR